MMNKRWLVVWCLLLLLMIAAPAVAQEANEIAGDKPVAEGAPARSIDRGDNAWMLTSSALVLAMTTPGLAMFYGGLVRKKNILSVLMQCIFLMAWMTLLWATVVYSLAFGGADAWIGNMDH
jgi:Amt family ammonium transporter